MIPHPVRAGLVAALTLILSAAAAAPAGALPIYASREGTKCVSCHFDPNGGGIRNDFGFSYGKNRHSMDPEDRWADVTVNPQLNDWIRLGLDMRVLYLAQKFEGSDGLNTSTFFPMQGNLRVAVTPHDRLSVVASHGVTVDGPGTPERYVARELYGLFQGLPYGGFAQIGRFRLPFGLRQEDHTSFTRTLEFLSYDSQEEDAGIALGSIGRNGWLELSYTNGGAPLTQQAETFAGKVAWSFPWLQGGISGYLRNTGRDDDRWSLYLTKTHGPLTLLGEYAGGSSETSAGTVNNLALFGEAVYRVSRGLNLRGKFDYFDSDRDGGGQIARRYSGDVDVNPMPFVEFKISYRRYDYSAANELFESSDYDEYLAMLFVPF